MFGVTLVLAAAVFFGGCGDGSGGKNASSQSVTGTETAGDASSGRGITMSVDDGGEMTINRGFTANSPMGKDGTWTVMVYFCGSDLESKKTGFATTNIDQMIEASTSDNVKFIIQTGGAKKWQNDVVDSSKIQRFAIQKGEMELLDEQPLADMGDGKTLEEFLKWGIANHPAGKMGLVLWDHGGGSIMGVCQDELFDDVIKKLNRFSKSLYESAGDIANLADFSKKAGKADDFGANNKSEGYTNMVDLAGLVEAGAGFAAGADEVISAVNSAVLYQAKGSEHKSACGLSTYYPLAIYEGTDELKVFGGIAVTPYYLGMVSRMAYAMVNDSVDEYDNSTLISAWNSVWTTGDASALNKFYDTYNAPGETGKSSYIKFEKEPGINENGNFGFTLTKDALGSTDSIRAGIYMTSDDGSELELGYTSDISGDWETGVFEDYFDGKWFCLPDGQILPVYFDSAKDSYVVYTSPVKLNGEATNLRFRFDLETEKITVEGAWDGIDENGMAARDIVKIKPGDTITPMYYCYTSEGGEEDEPLSGDTFTAGKKFKITREKLPDAKYQYAFIIDDIYGDYLMTDFWPMRVKKGKVYYEVKG